ncbi:hypothetical protein [Nitrobacter winogradskyi]|uniref:Uncharacterized protein n=2 Tax=Nitrobacter winogradskyi TaxID=913 RepID=A0ACC6AL34_NITWI|nr:hypothetical protein [Nitrobacter winogradskyi]MCP2000575.1 hypothetical protein [Nitrobacter winogradskyi]GEC14850.1 hypothetical protein NWI01_07420 [Nitrobacter winogradskyi]
MIRFAVILSLLPLLAVIGVASAQTATEKSNSGCARDVAKYCRAQMNDGDMVVLSCLRAHRAKLSKKCARTLAVHGQ